MEQFDYKVTTATELEKFLLQPKRFLHIDGNTFDTHTIEGRNAARMYAFTVAAQSDKQTYKMIMDVVGKEG